MGIKILLQNLDLMITKNIIWGSLSPKQCSNTFKTTSNEFLERGKTHPQTGPPTRTTSLNQGHGSQGVVDEKN